MRTGAQVAKRKQEKANPVIPDALKARAGIQTDLKRKKV